MNILPISSQSFTSSRKLVPIKDFQGPVLKLTKGDKARIEDLQKKKGLLEFDYCKVINYCKEKCFGVISDNFANEIGKLEFEIKLIDHAIKEIKINRYKKQMAKKNGK